jgi:site-specific DNA-methyltransferase (adenine-specific)
MRYLCRLITPPGGVVLDPFAGSGSTGVAAKAEGFGFIGIEREAEYVRIAQKRLGVDALAPRRSEEAARPRVPPFAMCLPELVAAGKWLASELAGVRR